MKCFRPSCVLAVSIFAGMVVLGPPIVLADPWYVHEGNGLSLYQEINGFQGRKIERSEGSRCGPSCGDYVMYQGNGCTGSIGFSELIKIENLPSELRSARVDVEYMQTKKAILDSPEIWKSTNLLEEFTKTVSGKSGPLQVKCLRASFEHKNGRLREGMRCYTALGEQFLSIALTCEVGRFRSGELPPFISTVASAAASAKR